MSGSCREGIAAISPYLHLQPPGHALPSAQGRSGGLSKTRGVPSWERMGEGQKGQGSLGHANLVSISCAANRVISPKQHLNSRVKVSERSGVCHRAGIGGASHVWGL